MRARTEYLRGWVAYAVTIPPHVAETPEVEDAFRAGAVWARKETPEKMLYRARWSVPYWVPGALFAVGFGGLLAATIIRGY